jgi:hypothetical protein
MEGKKQTFVMACNSFFGRKPNQTLQEFNAELKALTPADRADFTKWFREVGIEISDAPAAAVAG